MHARKKKNTQKINNLKQNSSRYHADYERLFFYTQIITYFKKKIKNNRAYTPLLYYKFEGFFSLKNHQHTRNTPSSFLSCVN